MAEHVFTVELYYDGAWHTADAREGGGSSITWGTNNPGVETDPAKAETDLDNLSRWYSPRSVASPLHGKIGQNTPIRFTLDGGDPYVLDAAEWNPQRTADDLDAWTSIQAAGVLRRIGRGTSDIASAVTRAALGVAPGNLLAYWPLEGTGDPATQDTESMYGRDDVAVTWSDSSLLVGSLPLPKVISVDETYTKNGQGKLNGVVPSSGSASTQWTVACWFIASTTYTADYNSVNVIEWGALPAGAASRAWEVAISSDFVLFANNGIFIQMDNSARASLDSFDVFDGQPHHMAVTLVQNGVNIDVSLYLDGGAVDTGTANTYTLRPVDLIKIGARPESDAAQNPNLWVGGIGVWDTALNLDEVAALHAAYDGYRGELAADRFARLCLENGIAPTVIGVAAESIPMGPQVPRTLLGEFHEIIRTDDAHIFETRNATNALTMVCGNAKMNVEPVLTISYVGDIVPGLRPVVGDVGIRNDVTAKDPQGIFRRVVQETGPRNIQAPEDDPQGVYRYDTKIDVNPSTTAGLADAAGWRVHQGTFDGTWYAVIVVDLDAGHLIDVVNTLQPGDLIALQDLPDDEALDIVHLVVLGFKDKVRAFRRTREIYCGPGEPYRTGILAETSGDTDPFVGRLETDGAEVTGGSFTALVLDDMEGGVGAWSPSDSTFVTSTAQKRSGARSGLMTVVGSPSQATVRSQNLAVTAGVPISGELWAYSVAGYSSVYAVFDWYDSGFGYLGTNGGTPTALAAGVWSQRAATVTPPVGAVWAQFGPTLGGSPPGGTAVFIDDAVAGGALVVATASGPLWTTDSDDFPMDIIVGGQRATIGSITGTASPQAFRLHTSGYVPEYPIPAGADVIVQQPIILTQ